MSLYKTATKTRYNQDYVFLYIAKKCIGVTSIDVIVVSSCSVPHHGPR